MEIRRCLNIILMLLMLTPSMVCFMTVSVESAHAAAIEKSAPPCHEMEKKSSSSPMFMADCTKNDLASVSLGDLPLPQLALFSVAFVISALFLTNTLSTRMRLSGVDPPIRGRPSFHRILITHRILQ